MIKSKEILQTLMKLELIHREHEKAVRTRACTWKRKCYKSDDISLSPPTCRDSCTRSAAGTSCQGVALPAPLFSDDGRLIA